MSSVAYQGGRYWIVYHNSDQLGYPAEGVLKQQPGCHLADFHHAISTKKSYIRSIKGDDVFLILGRKVQGKTRFYLWNKTTIEKVEPIDRDDLFHAYGPQSYLHPPQVLNDKFGFVQFRNKAGNFALGLQNITDWDFLKIIKQLYTEFKCTRQSEITYKDYLTQFEKSLPK